MRPSAASSTASIRSCTADRMRARSARISAPWARGSRIPVDISSPPPPRPELSALHKGASRTLANPHDECAARDDEPSPHELAGRGGGLRALRRAPPAGRRGAPRPPPGGGGG